jgi:hypothetical protein
MFDTDTDTKRRLDTARDIVVGKVPDPKRPIGQERIRGVCGKGPEFR